MVMVGYPARFAVPQTTEFTAIYKTSAPNALLAASNSYHRRVFRKATGDLPANIRLHAEERLAPAGEVHVIGIA